MKNRLAKFSWLGLLSLAASVGTVARSTPLGAAEPIDNDELVATAEFTGLPDKDSHSGVLLDQVALGSISLIQPGEYDISIPASTPSLRVVVFDGNNAGQWDQEGSSGPIIDSIANYTLHANSRVGPIVAFGESEAVSAPLNTPGAVVFTNARDGRWDFLFDGAHDAAALQPGGLTYRYRLVVDYRNPGTGAFPAINGFKLAVNGRVLLTPQQNTETIVGGFIGGLVDSSNSNSLTLPAASRNHYPQSIKAAYPGEPWASDPFVNNYSGVIRVPILLQPAAGQTWAQYIAGLILEEGDTDDASDETGIGPNGLEGPVSPGLPPDNALPPNAENAGNDGGYTIPRGGVPPANPANGLRNNLHYRMPVGSDSTSGRPRYVLLDPDGIPQATRTDLSGNVDQSDPTGIGFERIFVPDDVAKPGIWVIQFENIDARNTIFIRTNAAPPPPEGCLSGRIVCDANCDGEISGGDAGIENVQVRVRPLLPLVGPDLFPAPTDGSGNWTICGLQPGDYEVFVDPAQPALANRSRTTPGSDAAVASVVPGDNRAPDFGYCCEEKCECGPDGKVHRISLVSRIWVGHRSDLCVKVVQRKGCDRCSPIVDTVKACFPCTSWASSVRGTNGILEIVTAGVQDGELVVFFTSTAQAPVYLDGAFVGKQRFDVIVDGCTTVSACDYVKCDCLTVNEAWPCGSCPTDSCHCRPKFVVADFVPWACREKPCTEGCTRTQGFWKTHNKYARQSNKRIPWPAPGNEDTVLCGMTWLEILKSPSNGEAWTILAKQWIAASLNCYAGACHPDAVRVAMERGTKILTENCPPLCRDLRESALAIAKVLDLYNNGRLGPKHCDDLPPPPDCRGLCALLKGCLEVPGPGDPDGSAAVEVEVCPDAKRLCFTFRTCNLDGVTAFHVHKGAAGATGPKVLEATFSPAASSGTTGCIESCDRALLRDILANPAKYYVNLHNAEFPGGAVRGQLGACVCKPTLPCESPGGT